MSRRRAVSAADSSSSRRPPRALLLLALAACAVSAIPLVYLMVRVFSDDASELVQILLRPRTPELLLNTVALSASVTLTTVIIGVPAAYLLARVALPFHRFWVVLAALPLAVPSYLAAYGWLAAVPTLHGFWASWFVLSLVAVPYVVLPVTAALRASTTGFDDVARTLGRGPLGAFYLGTWPQIRSATLAGALLVCLYTLADFGGVALFRFPVLTTAIQQAYGSSFNRNYAAILALVLVLLASVIVFGERAARGRAARQFSASGAVVRRRVLRSKRVALPGMLLLAAVSVLAVIVPVGMLLVQLFHAETLRETSIAELVEALANTLSLSFGGAMIAVALALPIGVLAGRYGGRLVNAIESAGYLALALPGIVVGLSLVFFSLAVVPAFYQTAFVLAFAYGVLFMPKAIGAIRSATAQVPTSLEDVARTLGYSRLRTWWSVTVRMSRGGIAAAALFVMVTAMKELPATLMLRPTGVDTLATELWSRTSIAAFGSAAPYAVALVLVAAVPAFLLSRGSHTRDVDA